MTTILYHPVHQTAEANQKASIKGEDQSDLLHPLTLPGYYIEPVPYIEYAKEEHKDYKYYNDPSWRHYWENTYVVFNQKDITFRWDKTTGEVFDTSFDIKNAQDFVFVQQGGLANLPKVGDQFQGVLVIQWNESLMCWPKKPNKNLWIEVIPYPDLHHNTGMELIGCDFPLGRWYRAINGAYACYKTEINVVRGTPLYMIRFRGGKDNVYKLERSRDIKPPHKVRQLFRVSQALKTWLPKKSWGFIKDDVEEKKCPFNFLFK